MTYENLLLEHNSATAIITINRPDKLNALNIALIDELSQCFKRLESDTSVRSILITGAGEKAFVAGADISEFANFTISEGRSLAAEGQSKLFDCVANLNKPVIAAINGFALGGGLELAMSCHIRIASDNARMGLPEVSLGVIPGYGGTQRLPQLIGKGRAMEMIFSAQMITAQEALQFGLVNHVTTTSELLVKGLEIAAKISRNSPQAISLAIKAVNAGFDGERGFNTEIEMFGQAFGTADFKEGTTAFLEKRKPEFKN